MRGCGKGESGQRDGMLARMQSTVVCKVFAMIRHAPRNQCIRNLARPLFVSSGGAFAKEFDWEGITALEQRRQPAEILSLLVG